MSGPLRDTVQPRQFSRPPCHPVRTSPRIERKDVLVSGDVESPLASPRVLTSNERALLDGFLRQEFNGVEALRVQARHVLASPGCTCGCGSIDLHVPDDAPTSSSRSPLPVEGEVLGDGGEVGDVIGGLIVFLDEGRLSYLEVYSFLDDPLPLPHADEVRW